LFTGQEFDGSDSGASPDEAVSWGKVKMDSAPVKVCADATLVFPLIVSQTFVKHVKKLQQQQQTASAISADKPQDATEQEVGRN
jgi:deoxyhypusine synthase